MHRISTYQTCFESKLVWGCDGRSCVTRKAFANSQLLKLACSYCYNLVYCLIFLLLTLQITFWNIVEYHLVICYTTKTQIEQLIVLVKEVLNEIVYIKTLQSILLEYAITYLRDTGRVLS